MKSRRLAIALSALVLAFGPCAALASAADPTGPSPAGPSMGTQDSPDLEQTVSEGERYEPGRKVVISRGHIDLGPKMHDGTWTLMVRDDTVTPPVWRDPEDVVVQLVDASRLPVPGGEQYSFLGMPGGTQAYVVPQTQNQQVVWIGWNTQDPAAVKAMGRGATLTYLRRQGPGKFSLFLQNGQVGGPQALWDGSRAEAQPLWVDVNTHTHANWVFEKPGVQLLEMEISATGPDGKKLSDRGTLRLAVGNSTTPDAARAAAFSGPAPAAAPTTSDGPAAEAGRQQEDSGIGSALLWVAVAAVVLGALVLVIVLRSRAARRAAETEVGR